MQTRQYFRSADTSLRDLIKFAYAVHDRQVEGGPSWIGTKGFDILAKPEGEGEPSDAQWRRMIQKLLTERFGLVLHRETRKMPTYILVEDESGNKMTPGDPNIAGTFNFSGHGHLPATSMTMDRLAFMLQALVFDRPVINRTGLTGSYDFTLTWRPDEFQFPDTPQAKSKGGPVKRYTPAFTAEFPDIFTAMRDQLGLSLEPSDAPTVVLVVDQAESPTEN